LPEGVARRGGTGGDEVRRAPPTARRETAPPGPLASPAVAPGHGRAP